MSRFTSLLLGLALCLAGGDAFGRVADVRATADAPTPAALEQPTELSKSLRRVKPKVSGSYAVPARKSKPRKAASATPTIYANINGYGSDGVGVYSFSPAEYGFTPVKIDARLSSYYGGAYGNGSLYVLDESKQAFVWNTDNWTLSAGPVASELVVGNAMAADPVDGTIYSCAYDILGRDLELVTVDPESFVRISTLGKCPGVQCIFFDLTGNLMAFDSDGNLYDVNKLSGELTLRGNTGVECSFGGGAVVDPASGACFYAVNDWTCALYEINLSDCTASLLYEFEEDEEINNIFILPTPPADGSPAAAENFEATFADGSLSGTLTWTMPTKTFGGDAGEGDLNYTLKCNDVVIASESKTWGASVSVPYEATAAGMYSFVLTLSTEAGESRPATTSLWVGHDMPMPATDVSVKRTGTTNAVSWKAPTTTVHGGYVDFPAVTYRVTRKPDNKTVADNLTSTTFNDELADGSAPVLYSYDVTATYNGNDAGTASSLPVMVGAIYYNSFDTEEQFKEWNSVTLQSSMMDDIPLWGYNPWHKAAYVNYCETLPVSAWLISPALQLEAGKTCKLSFDVWCSNSDYDEQMSVYISKSDAAINIYKETPLIDKMKITSESDRKQTVEIDFTPTESAAYYLTFHGCSRPDQGTIYLDNVLFSAVPVYAVPAAPDIACEIMGGNMVMVSVTAPSADVDNQPLESLESIIVSRNGVAINTKENPPVGETFNFIDMLPADDTYTYSAIAYSAAGASAAGSTVVSTVAAGKPHRVTNVSATEEANSGKITLSWDAPATDLNNRPIIDGTLTFDIYAEGSDEPLFSDLTSTSHTWQAVEGDSQEFLSFYVIAKNEAGSSYRSEASLPAAFGTPYRLPFAESFAGMQPSTIWSFYNPDDYSEGKWLIVAASETPAANPVDGDGGMLAFTALHLDDTAWATSGKIDLGEGDAPRLTFNYFAQNSKEGKDQLDVYVSDGSGFKQVDSFTMRDLKVDGWQKREIDLGAYSGKTISLRLVGKSFRTENFMLIDNIEIRTAQNDLAVTTFGAPSSVFLGKSFKVESIVANNSAKSVSDYSVSLMRDGAEVARKQGSTISGGASAAFIFDQEPDASWPEEVTYSLAVNYDADMVPDNNTSADVKVKIEHNDYPSVGSVAAAYGDAAKTSVELTWTAPDRSQLKAEEYTENFEFLKPFEINPACDWTFIDGDGDETFGSQNFPFTGMSKPMAYIVFDANHFNITYVAHSGTQYLASMNAVSKQTDDWMISPELSGEAQVVSFHARSYSNTYGLEAFQVLASSTGTSPDDFTVMAGTDNVPTDWTPYRVALPEGTRYFAIRCVSDKVFAFFVDDVTYVPAVNPVSKFGILGYNVYRNGVRLNEKPLNAVAFTDHALPAGTPSYCVSVVYDHGESPLSDAVVPDESAIEEIAADEAAGNDVYDLQGRRVVAPRRGIYIVNGQKTLLK